MGTDRGMNSKQYSTNSLIMSAFREFIKYKLRFSDFGSNQSQKRGITEESMHTLFVMKER